MNAVQFQLRLALLLILGLGSLSVFSQKSEPGIIPQPVRFESGKGKFTITEQTRIVTSPASKELSRLADFMAERFRIGNTYGKSGSKISNEKPATISLELRQLNDLGNEGYKLVVDKESIVISANTGHGIFNGIMSLFQLLPAEAENRDPALRISKWEVPACLIVDYPRFEYRGMHLDVCRHMFPVEFIKKYIDLMSMYKLNTFHWHLTDDQGWRLEIKKYPLLTEIGSERAGSPVVRNAGDDGKRYGGYYTQKEAREIVAYAASRYVTVIPEIEMPGHAMAALASYPWLGCTGGPYAVMTRWGVSDDIYCAGNDAVFTFLEDVLNEVMNIFPSGYIHIGGDEAPKVRWHECPLCRKRMQDEGLADENELQSYFIRRIEKFLNANGRQIIGWDEILEGGLAPQATVMSWRGTEGGIQAAQQGHPVIMTPGSPCYFDHYQGIPSGEPLAIGGYNPLKSVYTYEPVPESLSKKEAGCILGAQGNVWTEYITDSDQVEYMAYPRALALAEADWSQKQSRDWSGFMNRLNKQLPRLKERNVNFSKSAYDVAITTIYDSVKQSMKVSLTTDVPGSRILYSTNAEQFPNRRYRKPFSISSTVNVQALLKTGNETPGKLTEKTIIVNDAFGKLPEIATKFSTQYSSKGAITLTDGCRAYPLSLGNGWLGFSGNDAVVTIDLGRVTEIRNVNIGFLYNPANWIFLPLGVDIDLSVDGMAFFPADGLHPELLTIREPVTIDYNLVRMNAKARYIKITAHNRHTCPDDHPGKGQNAWLFLDEIMVNSPDDPALR